MSRFPELRYFRRRENNGYWSLVPLRGPLAFDAVMVNESTIRILDLLEDGKTMEQIVDMYRREFPEEKESRLRADVFHAVWRLQRHGFVDAPDLADSLGIVRSRRGPAADTLQPCPVEMIPELSQALRMAGNGGDLRWLYSQHVERARTGSAEGCGGDLYDADRIVESQTVRGEIFWAYRDGKGRITGALSTDNYMLGMPVVQVATLAAAADGEEGPGLATLMLAQLAEILSILGLNQKMRILSCPSRGSGAGNLTIFDESFFSAMAQCRFRRSAALPGEIEGDHDVEYFDRML